MKWDWSESSVFLWAQGISLYGLQFIFFKKIFHDKSFREMPRQAPLFLFLSICPRFTSTSSSV